MPSKKNRNDCQIIEQISRNRDEELKQSLLIPITSDKIAGLRVPIVVSEQGVGRGVEPVTSYYNNNVSEGSGGYWFTTYAPKPCYITNMNRSVFVDKNEVMFINLTNDQIVEIEIWAVDIQGYIFYGESWLSLLKSLTSILGRQPSDLPVWTQEGAIVGLEGGTENVTKIIDKLLDFQFPIAAWSRSPSVTPVFWTPELLKRWSEFAAFGSAIYRTHIGSSTNPINAQIYDTNDSILHFAEFAYIFKNLSTYRQSLIYEATTYGYPLMRPLALHYFYDQQIWSDDFNANNIQLEYLFGEDFIIKPTLDKDIPSSIGFPCVFYKQSSNYGMQLRAFVIEKGFTTNYQWVR
eukprot:gene18990-24806_t